MTLPLCNEVPHYLHSCLCQKSLRPMTVTVTSHRSFFSAVCNFKFFLGTYASIALILSGNVG